MLLIIFSIVFTITTIEVIKLDKYIDKNIYNFNVLNYIYDNN